MLHLFTKVVTQLSELFASKAITFFTASTAADQPASDWFLFPTFTLVQKLYFMLRCNNTIGKNVSAELAT
jgi:hypothetical protein